MSSLNDNEITALLYAADDYIEDVVEGRAFTDTWPEKARVEMVEDLEDARDKLLTQLGPINGRIRRAQRGRR